ncbi:MAG TPA: DUF4129 domain-containing protein [Thermoguttaceae bacterium]|nr:DUF4129 domain-containing protein [Thermoguttaceae bacterium]
MARRLDKTLGDYLGIAISPVLIMTLVGSLIYFLLLVVYEGQYGERLHFIFAMFVMGAVLIGRIAIEEGKERANAFAAPLAVVTLLAINKFTDLGWVGSLLLIGLIWWCAHKLTWDCTLIDENEDASGEGLMQTIGLDEKAAQTGPPEPEEAEEPEGVTSRDAEPPSWWERFVRRQRRPHAPGVWVVYFSLAALPLFGIGQLFIPKEDVESRGYAFQLLLVYVASGLALLLATSFLGLRRYLRQRHLEMPAAMAGLWITTGCVLIVAILFFALLLPRPGAELELAELPFHVGSSRLESSRHAVMKSDPAEEDRGGPRVGTREEDQDIPSGSEGAGDERGSPGGAESDQKGGAAGKEGEQGGSDQGSQGQEGSSSTGSKEGRGDSQSGAESQQQRASSQSQGEQGSSSSDSRGEEGRSNADSQARQESSRSSAENGDRDSRSKSEGERQGDRSARDDQGRGAKSESKSPEDEQGRRSRPDSKKAESEKDGGRSRAAEADERRESESESSSRGGWRESDRGGDEAQQPDSENTEDGGTADQGDRRPWFDPAALMGSATSSFGTLLKWIFYGVLLLVIGYWLWRSRADLLAAMRSFLQELREFWQRLFGGRAGAADQAAESGEGPQAPTHRPFADFPDPFATGMADRCSPEELVRYSFEALEAWAREHGWARGPEQTPHEFAHDLGTRVHSLSQDVRRLADLYCRVAYASDTLSRTSVAPLKQLWQELRHREPVSV